MKIRSGFVSNSSSSSFIVGFPSIPGSPESLEVMMFGKPTEIQPYDFVDPTPSIEIAKRVFRDMSEGDFKTARLNKRKAVEVLQEGSFPGKPPYDYKKETKSSQIRKSYYEENGKDITDDGVDPRALKAYFTACKEEWDLESKLRQTAAKAFIEGFWTSVKGMKVFKFEYADDSGESNLEHGDIFRKLPHVQISKH